MLRNWAKRNRVWLCGIYAWGSECVNVVVHLMRRIFSFSWVTIHFSPFSLLMVSLPLEIASFQIDRERSPDRNRRNEKTHKVYFTELWTYFRLKVDLWRNGCELCRRTYSLQLCIPEWWQFLLEVWAQQFWLTTACVIVKPFIFKVTYVAETSKK